MWREIKRVILQHHRFILTTHIYPDGDGIGSASALTQLLKHMGKEVRFISDSPIPAKFRFLDFHRTFETYDPEHTDLHTEVLVVLDTNRKERIGRLATLLGKEGVTSICIDHHPQESAFTDYAEIDPQASSSGVLVYTLYKEFGFELDLQAATGIYCSILCDTGRFSYSSTTRKAHKIADECIKIGVDPDLIYSKLFQHIPLAQVKMFAKSMQRADTFLDDRVLVQVICREDYEMIGEDPVALEQIDLEYILEFNKSIDEVECVVLLRELADNQVRVSVRSKTDLDISPLVKALGGGGHSKAGGAIVKGSVDVVKLMIISKLKSMITSLA
jgi:phosphoesterase RecJ-like protein